MPAIAPQRSHRVSCMDLPPPTAQARSYCPDWRHLATTVDRTDRRRGATYRRDGGDCASDTLPAVALLPSRPVLAAFGAHEEPDALAGGEGLAFRAGTLVLKRVHDVGEAQWTQ